MQYFPRFSHEFWDPKGSLKGWEEINRLLRRDEGEEVRPYEAVLDAMDLVLTLYPSSIEPERGFSNLKFVKTARRNLLLGTTLNNLLGVRLLTEGVADWSPAGNLLKILAILCKFVVLFTSCNTAIKFEVIYY